MTSHSNQKFDHVMIDIETMSLSKWNALILSIGMLEFDPTGLQLVLGARSLIRPSLAHQLLLGREVDKGTQEFWAKQSPAAAEHWLDDGEGHSGRCLLSHTCDYVRNFAGDRRVWANGTQFDLTNLETLAKQIDVKELWHYRSPRDMRTFCAETPKRHPDDELAGYEIVEHEPISDCIVQAFKVWQHWIPEPCTAHHPV